PREAMPNPAIKSPYRMDQITAHPLNNPNRHLQQRPCRIGKSGGIYSLTINKSAPFVITDRLALVLHSIRIQNDTLTSAGHSLASLAAQYGTPLYIYDRATMDASVAAYQGALKAHYPAAFDITYAGKAF